MTNFTEPRRVTVDASETFKQLAATHLVKDLAPNEELCEFCGGTGLAIADNPWMFQGERSLYIHQSISFCRHCINGVVYICPDCGKRLPRGTLYCDCAAAVARRYAEYRRCADEREARMLTKAAKHEASALGSLFEYCCYGEQYFTDWQEFFDDWADCIPRPEYVWACAKQTMQLDAMDIVEDACESLYEDAVLDIDRTAMTELQDDLDRWVKANGVTSYEPDYENAVRIPWEEYDA